MALLRLIAEGVGPFKRLDLDFSDGNGRPHLGPHILAGVNGSGKSTVLRAIARASSWADSGFDSETWIQLTKDQAGRVLAVMSDEVTGIPYAMPCAGPLSHWREVQILALREQLPRLLAESPYVEGVHPFCMAGYAPSLALSRLDDPKLSVSPEVEQDASLSFHGTVQNAAIQSWLVSLYSKSAIVRSRGGSAERYTRSLVRLESALSTIYGEKVWFDFEIEPFIQANLCLKNRSLNFSQLPDGVRNTVGWVADFMRRQDAIEWPKELGDRRPGLLLLDEVDAHLHPRWQRLLLPAMREALPDVQIIATSHSPFVISSCPEAIIHVLEVDADGVATNRPPAPAPVGESITTTLKDIFDVDSRFDIRTERELKEWNDLTKRVAGGRITPDETVRLSELTNILSERSEELRSLVGPVIRSSDALLNALLHR
jgi:energy-coupling factor transporter ATP-binding protein EcfA2